MLESYKVLFQEFPESIFEVQLTNPLFGNHATTAHTLSILL